MNMDKKIFIVLNSLKAGGGVQEVRVQVANALVARGYSVSIVVPHVGQDCIRNIDSRVRIINLGCRSNRLALNIIRSPLRMSRVFKEEGPIAVLGCTVPFGFATAFALWLSGCDARFFCSVHNTLKFVGGYKQIFVNIFSLIALNFIAIRASGFIGVSKGVAKDIESRLIYTTKPCSVIYNPLRVASGISPESFCADGKRNGFGFRVVSLGRLEHQKGFDILISAFSRIKSNAILEIAGEGSQRALLEKMIQDLGVSSRVFLRGYIADVPGFLGGADLFVFPSRYEGFGNVLIEALYSGVPIVSARCPHGPEEILGNGEYGILVPTEDVDALSQKIDEALYQPVSPKDRWREFTLERAVDRYETVLLGEVCA